MVFGVFDGLHAGHRAFLRAAKKRGDELVAVVARDAAVRLLKKKKPRFDEKARVRALRASRLADRVILGDKKQGIYRVIARYAPDTICLGYDQQALAEDMRTHREFSRIPLIRLKPHQPMKFKTSLLS
ncbi:MAG: adenylyltransferase/cytidyltransferase family protein [Patescibacteria group bacterium]